MQKIDLDIPANTEPVTPNLKKDGRLTLRSVLPAIHSPVMLCVNDESYVTTSIRAKSGSDLLKKLERSRIIERSRILEGEAILNIAPEISIIVLNGSIVLQLCVTPPKED